MTNHQEGRLKEIMTFALELGWIKPKWNSDYPLMQLSEVEKCMIAMNDDVYYNRMKKWYEDSINQRLSNEARFMQQ